MSLSEHRSSIAENVRWEHLPPCVASASGAVFSWLSYINNQPFSHILPPSGSLGASMEKSAYAPWKSSWCSSLTKSLFLVSFYDIQVSTLVILCAYPCIPDCIHPSLLLFYSSFPGSKNACNVGHWSLSLMQYSLQGVSLPLLDVISNMWRWLRWKRSCHLAWTPELRFLVLM